MKTAMYTQVTPDEALANHLDKRFLAVDVTDGRTWQVKRLIELTGIEIEDVTKNSRYIFLKKEEEATSNELPQVERKNLIAK